MPPVQAKDVRDVIFLRVEDAVLPRILVMKEKVTVMVQEMVDRMMEIEDVVEILCVEATTA